ncbi:MAG: Mur ligase domain-containing protein, partial [Gammaproteobacteria bacterium]
MHIHILGIGGTFMAGVALLARELGHEVAGSDGPLYPPMSEVLANAGIHVCEGYKPEHLKPAPDLVVIGNIIARGNPAAEYVLDRGLPYASGPQFVAERVLAGRQVIAVAGTHGKTTTTSLVAWLLEATGRKPGFLIGGLPENFPAPVRLGKGEHFVIEADEYDTAFFDRRPKFIHYRPKILALTNLEYDHADLYPDLAAIERQFHYLLCTV